MDLACAFAEVVDARHVLSDPELKSSYEHNYTGRYGAPARVVVRPADTQQVAAVMALCARRGAAVVPQGGNTGLVGGGVPRGGEVVVSLQRLNTVEEVNAALGQVTIGAGAPGFPANIRSSRGRRFHDHPPARLAIAIRGQVRDAERLTGDRPPHAFLRPATATCPRRERPSAT